MSTYCYAQEEIASLKKEKKYLIGNSECDHLIRNTTKIMGVLKSTGAISDFNETIFKTTVTKIWITKDEDMIYEMKNGLKLRIKKEEVR